MRIGLIQKIERNYVLIKLNSKINFLHIPFPEEKKHIINYTGYMYLCIYRLKLSNRISIIEGILCSKLQKYILLRIVKLVKLNY